MLLAPLWAVAGQGGRLWRPGWVAGLGGRLRGWAATASGSKIPGALEGPRDAARLGDGCLGWVVGAHMGGGCAGDEAPCELEVQYSDSVSA